MFNAALKWDTTIPSANSNGGGHSSDLLDTTSGLAPTLAKVMLWMELFLEDWGLLVIVGDISIAVKQSSMYKSIVYAFYTCVFYITQWLVSAYAVGRDYNGILLAVLIMIFCSLLFIIHGRRRPYN